jgi:crossover junction endodeoxyribonuclease RuvC
MGVSPQQYEQMKNRVAGRTRSAEPVLETPLLDQIGEHEVILGIDPSLRSTGFGVLRAGKPHPQTLAFGTIPCPAGWPHSRCLLSIAQNLREVIRQHNPTLCIIEGLFYAQNLQTALAMGQARGAALVAAAEGGLQIYEIAPRKVKQAIVGFGGAQKLAVAKMVQRMLRLPELPPPDAADALGIALAHLQSTGRYALIQPRKV